MQILVAHLPFEHCRCAAGVLCARNRLQNLRVFPGNPYVSSELRPAGLLSRELFEVREGR
jgi:hypothetical protein